ncbi:MAG: orotate phosphoribosyltransferase [Bdellovibrionales bacterium]|jgi:orotate phosphoribosyltransferase|nr:orotate phosphoribosyltransferase [Bdellovibrionales bacterium]
MKENVAKLLLDVGCVKISPSKPFTYASGLKGPIYCDNRKILSHPKSRAEIVGNLKELVVSLDLDFDHFAGLATAGIPHAAFLAHELNKSMVYVRSKPKGHGKGNQVEGDYKEGDKVLLVEDLVNQASSLVDAVNGVKKEGLEVVGCVCIVDYQMDAAKKRLEDMGIKLFSLTNFENLVKVLNEKSQLTEQENELLISWHKDPKNWECI